MKVFVPFSEFLLEHFGAPLGELVPFQIEYLRARTPLQPAPPHEPEVLPLLQRLPAEA